MEPAQQDAAVDVGPTAVCNVIDVVRFAVGGGHRASDPGAPAVADRERKLLLRAEQSLLAPEVQGIAPAVDRHVDGAVLAEGPVDDRPGEGVSVVLGVTCGDEAAERVARSRLVLDDDHPHPGLADTEDVGGVGNSSCAKNVDEKVILELFVAARVGDEVRSGGALGIRDEPRPAAPGSQSRSEHRPHEQRHLVVERDVAVMLAVLVDPHPNGALLVAVLEPARRPGRVEDVAHLPRPASQFLDRCALDRLVDECLRRDRPRESR